MISFNYLTDFKLSDELKLSDWINTIIGEEGYKLYFINYIFCDDEYLHNLNVEYLDHDDYTDVIGFDYSVGKKLQGDIFISLDRVEDNARKYGVDKDRELFRVMAHGVLHFCGYKDKGKKDSETMRAREDHYLEGLT